MAEYLERAQIDCLKIVPSHWEALARGAGGDRLLPRQRLVLGGETFSWELWGRLREALTRSGSVCRVFNHYGPTEATVGILAGEVPQAGVGGGASVPLGRPLANTRVYVLDEHLEAVPVGVAGELYVGGVCLARGYAGRGDLTAERFVADPLATGRLYRTGDRVRWLGDGQVEFLGRVDRQVKVRGYRVEPGEVEGVLRRHPEVRQSAVLPHGPEGERRLVAYAAGSGLTAEVLRAFLRERLPEYLVPSEYVLLAELPLTANGKVDRQALPAPEAVAAGLSGYVAPRTEVEARLAVLWQEVLRRERVGVRDNFFDAGGSLAVGDAGAGPGTGVVRGGGGGAGVVR